MIRGFMTFRTGKAIPSHMDITVSAGVIQLTAHVGMLNLISPATEEMTIPAGLPAGRTHILGHVHQIDLSGRHTGSSGYFLIAPGCIMAYQTVDVFHILKIETLVFPAVSRMA
jgi:hypothetical protein